MESLELCFLHILGLIVVFGTVLSENVIVNTESGKVEGKAVASIFPNEKYYSFLGIPYAMPPIGDLRFMPPQPHPGWPDVLNCKKERHACAQLFLPNRPATNQGYYGDEDCLNLNIQTPKLPTDETLNFPVIVFLLNENFRMTYNLTKDYSPDFFMKEDIIIVTINHRLGVLGFLSFEDDLLPGNNGLRDVILALKWIKKNINNFGGDPNKITLMGNQGGAVIVDILLHSPKTEGLFNSAILQSGTSFSPVYFNNGGKIRAQDLAKFLEYGSATSAALIKNLNYFPAMNLTEAELGSINADEARAKQVGIVPFIPVLEHDHPDAVITKLPDSSTRHKIPVMIGYNSREAIQLCERYLRKPQYLTFADRDFMFIFPIRPGYHFKINDNVYHHAVREIKDFYFEEGYIKVSNPGEYMTYIGDTIQFYHIDYTVRTYANESVSPVYYYSFDYSGEFNLMKKTTVKDAYVIDGAWGASMRDELCYLFVCKPLKQEYIKALEENDSDDINVIRNMVRLYTNFAKTGNPTPPGEDFIWTPATSENKECLLINDDLEMKTNLHDERVKFWDEFIEKHRQEAIDGVVKDLKDEL